MANQPTLWTFNDVVDHLLNLGGASTNVRNKKLARRAILSAYRTVPNARRWSYYQKKERITTDNDYSEGTVQYDHTGGSNERELTLSNGTWPANAARGWVAIDNVPYQVDERVSDTVVTLEVNSNPGADVSSGTSYKWFRPTYTMPLDFRSAGQIVDYDDATWPEYVPPNEWQTLWQNYVTPGRPRAYTFISDEDYTGALAMALHPPPEKVYHFDFIYARQPLALRTLDYNDGTVTISSGTTVTGSSTSWTSRMEGGVIRFGDSSNVPDGIEGENPYVEERIITSVTNNNSLEIDAALDNTYSGVKYRISDLVDIDQGVMFTAFLRCAELEYTILLSDTKWLSIRNSMYRQALQDAIEADSRSYADRTAGFESNVRRLRDLGVEGSDIGA